MYHKAKGKSVHMKPWCKRKSAVFTIEISSDNLITKLVQNIPTGIISHNLLKSMSLAMWLFVMSFLGYWICVIFEVFICN